MFFALPQSIRTLFVFTFVYLLSCSATLASDASVIERASSLPETTPWNLEQLSKPPAYQWASEGKVHSLYYEGESFQGKPTRVFAYYATPGSLSGDVSLDKKLPAVVLVHGGGGKAFDDWARLWASRGYAAIAMDLAGRGPDREQLADGGPDQSHDMKFGMIREPVTEQWSYHAVANVILAHSLLRSFAEVDTSNTAIVGISWGGYLTCIVSGLDSRFKAAVPVYGCGFLGENSAWLKRLDSMSNEDRQKWLKLWDPSQYVGSARMPMLFINGGKDSSYPPDSHAKTYSLVQSAKNLHFVPELPHGHIFDKPPAVEVFIDHQLRQGKALPKIAAVEVTDGVTAKIATETALTEAALHYTQSEIPGDFKTREWKTVPATIEGNAVRAKLPPQDSTIWFLTVKDERGVTVSSDLVFP